MACCAIFSLSRLGKGVPILTGTKFKIYGLIFFFTLLMLVGLPLFSLAPTRFIGAIVRESMIFPYIMGALAFCFFRPNQRDIFFLAYIPLILLGFYLIRTVDIKGVVAVDGRGDAFEQTGQWIRYALVVAIGSASAGMTLISLATSKRKWITVCLSSGLLLWIYSSLVYSKRQGLLEFGFLAAFILYYFIFTKGGKGRQWALAALGIGMSSTIGFIILKGGALNFLLSRVIGRFSDIGYEGVENLDRIREVTYMLESMTPLRLIIGNGFLSFDYGFRAFYNLHLGYGNLLFKGGIFLVLFYIAVGLFNIYTMLRNRVHPNRHIAMFFAAYMLLQYCYAGLWGYVPSLFWVGFAVFGPEIFAAIGQGQRGMRGGGLPPALGPHHRRRF
ncbi:MAG TPA: hypothetical protein DCX06_02705 [Opitutae bacterium]|nr:hypothetical protein [Opitutae bacterium]